MAKIKDFNILESLVNAFYGAVATATLDLARSEDQKVGDDLLFVHLPEDTRKDNRAGITHFNDKTRSFSLKLGGRDKLIVKLGIFLNVASKYGYEVVVLEGDGNIYKQLECCYRLKLSREGEKMLKEDLYLKFTFLPKELIFDNFGKEVGIKNDEYWILVDFHD